MPLRKQNNKLPQPCRKREPILGYHRLVREATRGITYEGHPLDTHIQQIDAYLSAQQNQRDESSNLTIWTAEWLEERLDWLDRLGKLFVKNAESNPMHIPIDLAIPITHIWDGYLYHSDTASHSDSIDQSFVWDMYVLLHRPLKCTLCPGWDAGEEPGIAKFDIEIPPPLNVEPEQPEESSDDEISQADHSFDPYEWIRKPRLVTKTTWNKASGKQYIKTYEQHFIDPDRMLSVTTGQLFPIILNTIANKPEDFGIKLQNWRLLEQPNAAMTDIFEVS
ncbi:unnamed protein product [Echinostoma caproni]|uniref:Uncharacterized protein n=1 Tax=Echinostoma caproni TaxID=27848 RepID=A0A183A2E1_9TREM|nr:unnamed protein product [Echinostoma caproni]